MVIGSPVVLNLVPGGVMKMVHVNQADKNIDIQFQIMNGNQPYNIPEGWTGTIRGTKGDAYGYAAAVTVTAGSNVVTAHLKEQLTAVAGVGNVFELVFESTSAKVSTENFVLAVERSALNDDTVISDSDLVYANQVLNQLQSVAAVNQQVQQNKSNIAAETTARQSADNTLQSNINAEASTRATTDASLQSQIDQLVAPSGEAPSAAEVLNARIGADGVTYPTLGDAIRTNDSELKSQLPSLMEVPITNGITRYVSNGELVTGSNSSRASSEPRRCHSNEKLLLIIYSGFSANVYTRKNNTWTQGTTLTAGNHIVSLQDNVEFCVTVISTASIPADKVTAKILLYSLEEIDYLAHNYEVYRKALFESSDFVQGSVYNGVLNPNDNTCISQRTTQEIPDINNGIVSFSVVGDSGVWQYRVSFYDTSGTFVQQVGYTADTIISIPSTAKFYRVSLKHSINGAFENITPDTLQNHTVFSSVPGDADKIISLMENAGGSPFFRTSDIEFIEGKFYDVTLHRLNDDANLSYVKLNVSPFRGGYISGQTSVAPNSRYGIGFTDKYDAYIEGHNSSNTGYYDYAYNLKVPDNAVYMYISRRNATADQWRDPVYPWDQALINAFASVPDASSINNDQVYGKLLNARHVKSTDNTPVTLLHFSDLHADTGVLERIAEYAERYGSNIDGMICTGDMVAGAAEQITSWWNPNIMTCVGNHDSASYSEGVYDWTALSMANRSAYYIEPFKSNWGIVHTTGLSYYYKDYTTQKVRLIVLDDMLYTGTPGAEATAQTAWLSGRLSNAITNGYHVLIALHAPHGGSTAKVCSFSRYGQGTMPTLADCNTPQVVIDAVATAITNGLHFIGYICGHTHQDNMWDATGDGTQMMYCVTCAASTQVAQWQNLSDMSRDEQHDAFNLVTIDTTNTLVKIVRGGGADIDDHMRTRKAICFNYSTGTVVGEVL